MRDLRTGVIGPAGGLSAASAAQFKANRRQMFLGRCLMDNILTPDNSVDAAA